MKLRATALCALLSFAACEQDRSNTEIRTAGSGSAEQEIQGGTFDPSSNNVVAIVMMTPGGGVGICSGSLIAPNLVLTAHHCVANTNTTSCSSNGFGTTFPAANFRVTTSPTAAETTLNQGVFPTVNNTFWFGASLVSVPPTPANNICGGDMALIRLTANVGGICPLIPRVDSAVAANEAYTAVGFGLLSPSGQSSGTRYTVSGVNVLCEGNCGFGTDATREWIGGSSAARGVCEGDSGGPALDSQRRVIGTVSRGDASSCNEAVYESVFGQAAWIKSVAAQAATAGGYPVPGWVNGSPTSINPCTGVDGGTGGGAGGGGAGGGFGGGFGGGGGSTGTCNAGTMCVDASGQGDFACVSNTGGLPPGAPACSETVACPNGFSCWQTGATSFACLQDCSGVPTGGGAGGGAGGGVGGGAGGGFGGGGGSTGGACTNPTTTCVDASGMGNFACIATNSSTGVPAGAQSCGTSPCPTNYSCWGTQSGNFCLQNCTPGATGGGAGGGGGPVGGGAGGGVPVGGGAGGGVPVGGGSGGGIPVGGGAGGGVPVGGGAGGGVPVGGGAGGGIPVGGGAAGGTAGGGTGGGTTNGGGTGGSGGAGGSGGSGGAGGGFMFPGLPEPMKKAGCSCTSVPEAGWLALLGLTLLRRRRK